MNNTIRNTREHTYFCASLIISVGWNRTSGTPQSKGVSYFKPPETYCRWYVGGAHAPTSTVLEAVSPQRHKPENCCLWAGLSDLLSQNRTRRGKTSDSTTEKCGRCSLH